MKQYMHERVADRRDYGIIHPPNNLNWEIRGYEHI